MLLVQKEDYKKPLMHGLPIPGETLNTYNNWHGYEEGADETEKFFSIIKELQ